MMYSAHTTRMRCQFCYCAKDEPDSSNPCMVSGTAEHIWQVEIEPVVRKRHGWWLMLLFTWDLLLGKLDKDEF